MKRRKVIFGIVCAMLPLMSLCCLSGTSETGNARQVTGAITTGTAAITDVQVQLVAEGYVPGTDTVKKVFTTHASGGVYTFENVPYGNYYLNACGTAGYLFKRFLRGPLSIDEVEGGELPTYPLENVAQITMTIHDSLKVTSVYIEGTAELLDVSSGTVVLSTVPPGVVTVVGISASGTEPQTVKKVTIEVAPTDTVEATLNSAPPSILPGEPDLSTVIARSDSVYRTVITVADQGLRDILFSLLDGPDGLELDETTGEVAWRFGDADEGGYRIGARATDSEGASRSIWWSVVLIDEAAGTSFPVIGERTGKIDIPYDYRAFVIPSAAINAYRYTWGDCDTSEWSAAPDDPNGGMTGRHAWRNAKVYTVMCQLHYEDGSFSGWQGAFEVKIVNPSIYLTLLGGDTVYIPVGDPDNRVEYYCSQVELTVKDGSRYLLQNPVLSIDVNREGGPYTITYAASNSSGDTVTAVRYVFIVNPEDPDTIPPVIAVIDSITFRAIGQSFTDPGVSAYDAVDGNLTDSIKTSGEVNTALQGIYIITYAVTDKAGNTAISRREIWVNVDRADETIPPVITLLGGDTLDVPAGQIIIDFITSYMEPGYRAVDNNDGDISAKVVASQITQLTGRYWYIDYTVADIAGNTTTARRIIDSGLSGDPVAQ